MPSTRKILRVFLASPGDLQEERKAIRGVVAEFNESWADHLGYQIELMGWEDTIAAYGRPQQIINQEVDRCDLFIGMIWKRWGTPPDRDGDFTSGFHEEFERSMARREQGESPDISLFFKQIPEEFMVDPGDDLKRVLNFRQKIIAEKKVLFQEFATVRQMEALARKCITAYATRIKEADESSEHFEVSTKLAKSTSEEAAAQNRNPAASPLTAEGFVFLKDLVDRLAQETAMADLTAFEVARFRLLANSISKPGNQDMDLGVHDINLLYLAHSEGMRLGRREVRCLARLGFQHLQAENVPLWRWYSSLSDSPEVAVVSSFTGATDDERVGAITVLDTLSADLTTRDDFLKRDWILDAWFSDDTSPRVRSAALQYLARNGTAQDYAVAKKEYDRSDHGTSPKALECMIQILLGTGEKAAAQQLIFESQFESLDVDTLRSVLNDIDTLETTTLLLGLEHRNVHVRRRSFDVLLIRGAIDQETAERVCQDADASLRNDAIAALLRLGKSFTDDDVKDILTRPPKRPGEPHADSRGRHLYARYRSDHLWAQSEATLIKQVDDGDDDDAYFARAEKYFARYALELRRDVDDTFGSYFEKGLRRMQKAFGPTVGLSLVKSFKGLEDFQRKELTRRGLDILCRKGKHEDLARIRKNLQGGFAGISKADAAYLEKRGEWTDIAVLAKAYMPSFLGSSLLTGVVDFVDDVARAIIHMSRKHSASHLFSIEIPPTILKRSIELYPESRFSKISHDALLSLFDHEAADVRKAAAIKAVRTLPAKRIGSILEEYLGKDKRYYNVVHWLDLGTSLSRQDALKVARAG